MSGVRANIDGTYYEGPTVAAIVRQQYGPGAIVRREVGPYYGQVVRRAYQGAYDVLATVRTVAVLPDDDGSQS